MSAQPWQRALVLGGIRSGKSEFAEAMVAGRARVRYVATARRTGGDAEWTARIDAHRARRPADWTTDEVGEDPSRLFDLLSAAEPADTLLVDDLGTWVAAVQRGGERRTAARARADRAGRPAGGGGTGVSGQVGAGEPRGRPVRRAGDGVGRALRRRPRPTNRAVAAACDRVVLVVAGYAVPVKGGL